MNWESQVFVLKFVEYQATWIARFPLTYLMALDAVKQTPGILTALKLLVPENARLSNMCRKPQCARSSGYSGTII